MPCYKVCSYLCPVLGSSHLYFEMEVLPEAVSRPSSSGSIVFHASNSSAIVEGNVIQLYKRCENSTTNNLLQSYTVTELDETKEWLEISIDMSSLPCPYTEKCIFSAQTAGNYSSLDALLVIYDYKKHGVFDITGLVSKTVEKRSAASGRNKTLLSEYTENGVNCSVQSVFLNYATDLPIFPDPIVAISPNGNGLNITFCLGTCNPVAPDINRPERYQFFSSIIDETSGPTPRICCIPDKIEHYDLIVYNTVVEIVDLESFPQVKSCHCVI